MSSEMVQSEGVSVRDRVLSSPFAANYIGLLTAIVAASVILSVVSPYFLRWVNFVNITNQIAVNLIIAVGMTIVITTEGIDLSVGSILALSSVAMASVMQLMEPTVFSVIVGVLMGIAIGVAAGYVNGVLINAVGVPPFIATLGMMVSLRGLALIVSRGRVIFNLPPAFETVFSGFVFGTIPRPILIALLAVVVGYIYLNHTPIGRFGCAIGGNERCAVVAGLSVKGVKYVVYCISGALAALSGLTLTGMMSAAEPIAGVFFELDAVAVVVMGGTSLQGGRGTVIGTALAALLLGVIRNGLNLLEVPAYYQQLMVGLFILIAVLIGSKKRV